MIASLQRTLAAGCAYLLRCQAASGLLRDYALPVGPSGDWVTAVAGLALAEAGARGVHEGATTEAARRAAGWLVGVRNYDAGWGYNAATGPDADSTAHVLALLRALGLPLAHADVDFLVAHRRADGGFATYDRRGAAGWGQSHIDVTPVVFLALPAEERIAFADETAAFLLANRGADGSWPAYWWRGRQYSTYWSLRALRAVGRHDDAIAPPCLIREPLHDVRSYFDLAYAIGILQLAGADEDSAVARLVRHLQRGQRSDGSWPGGYDLRVTDARLRRPGCDPPLPDDRSRYYADLAGIMTTAHVVRVLAALPGM
jgi:hypothetical protein